MAGKERYLGRYCNMSGGNEWRPVGKPWSTVACALTVVGIRIESRRGCTDRVHGATERMTAVDAR